MVSKVEPLILSGVEGFMVNIGVSQKKGFKNGSSPNQWLKFLVRGCP